MPFDIKRIAEIEPGEEEFYDYQDELLDLFVNSPEGQARAKEDEGMAFWAKCLIDYGYNYVGTPLHEMDEVNVEELLTEVFPRKISLAAPEDADEGLPAMIAFWEYLKREYKLANADDVLGYLRSLKTKEFRAWMNDSSRFGMAKSFMTMGRSAGFDMSNEDELNTFMTHTTPSCCRPAAAVYRSLAVAICHCSAAAMFQSLSVPPAKRNRKETEPNTCARSPAPRARKTASANSRAFIGLNLIIRFPSLLPLAANPLYAGARATWRTKMNKQALATESAISPARAATTTARGNPRLAKPASPAAKPSSANADFWQGYDEWQPVKANPAKRRAYIKKLCRRIAEEFHPEKIILFGSQAYGKPTPDSDVDLLVVMQFEGGYFEQSHKIRMRLGLTLPIDLLVRTPEELQYRLEIGDRFMQEIVECGKVMYEATDN